jgi:probable DNA metabolism protein
MRIEDKLDILASAARYDVSCASSGSRRSNTEGRLGNAVPSGICHSYTEDGRCVSLLKILYTNSCIYDCAYCINRRSNDIPRSAFTLSEIVSLTIDFYRRNYIEGLFLSSGIVRSPDDTMERLVRVVKDLRGKGYNGYIHLKCVPFASRRLVKQAGLYADRLSVNIELPSEVSLKRLTKEKTYASVLKPMGVIGEAISEVRENRKRLRHTPQFAPAGQSTQMIIGASPESDFDILRLANRLYLANSLKRVYYSAYMPVEPAGKGLPDLSDPPLLRENRLYQADWLIRLYGFSIDEVISSEFPYLDLAVDPKQSFALRHPALFPVDINLADREMILRVPGIGLKSARRIIGLRRKGRIRFEHLRQLGVVVSRAQRYIRCDGIPLQQWQGKRWKQGGQTSRSPHTEKRARTCLPRQTKRVFTTDGTFEGLMTAIFEAYTVDWSPLSIESASPRQLNLFEKRLRILTDNRKSDRVWKALKLHLGSNRRRKIFEAFLSGTPDVGTLIYRYVRNFVPENGQQYSKVDLTTQIQIASLSQKVRREAHRMKGFVRFKQTSDQQFTAIIAPQYDVLPLVRRHFEARFADQSWMIFDTQRSYGLCSDGIKTCIVSSDSKEFETIAAGDISKEQLCKKLWRRYHAASTIPQRYNPQLHLRQLPRRFWKYLPEKQAR